MTAQNIYIITLHMKYCIRLLSVVHKFYIYLPYETLFENVKHYIYNPYGMATHLHKCVKSEVTTSILILTHLNYAQIAFHGDYHYY